MKLLRSFTRFEITLWLFSVCVTAGSALIFGRTDPLALAASLIGVTSLIFIAKGHYIGQLMMVVFALLYGIISILQSYYGEAITYLGMTTPSAIATMIIWIRHPYQNSEQVEVARLNAKKILLIIVLTAAATVIFYFILNALGNAQLTISTVSITTSFAASMLMLFRSPYYAIAYAANDIILIVLWVLASLLSISNAPMAACFSMFLLNDIYGFISWKRMKKQQTGAHDSTKTTNKTE